MIGIIPAAGTAERIQPLGCSKELLPVGSRREGEHERPKAVAEYLVERMIAAGAQQICLVISAEKTDMFRYFARRNFAAEIFFALQPQPAGLCDAVFRAAPFARAHEQVLIGLPDTIWFPEDCYARALNFSRAKANLVLFPVEDASHFDAVVADERGMVERIEVKAPDPSSIWVWGAITATGASFSDLHALWLGRGCADAYLGDLFNAYIERGHRIGALSVGEHYIDVGTLPGYHAAQDFLRRHERKPVTQPIAA